MPRWKKMNKLEGSGGSPAIGFTFVSMIIAGGLLGWLLSWILGQAHNERTFIVTGAVIGIVYGMIDFIRDALKAVNENQQ